MRLIFWIVSRLIKSPDRFLSLITYVSTLGVMLGVFALLVVTSVITGFENELKSTITRVHGDVILFNKHTHADTQSAQEVEAQLRRLVPEAEQIRKGLSVEAMVLSQNVVTGSLLQGIEPDVLRKAVQDWMLMAPLGSLPAAFDEVLIGKHLAEKLHVQVGDTVKILFPFWDQQQPKAVKVRVVGIVQLGLYEYDSKFIVSSLENVQGFVRKPHFITQYAVDLKKTASVQEVVRRMRAYFDFPFRVRDWTALNHNLFAAIALEKIVIKIILAIIIMVAAFSVSSTLMMFIHDKASEVAILKVMGFTKKDCFLLFSIIGVSIGMVGALFGVSLALLFLWILKSTQFFKIPASIYHLSALPVVIQCLDVLMILGFTMVVSFLATLYPAKKVIDQSPLQGIKKV